ncbi:MAG: 30S ribosomal protein S13 [Candidatus Methanodesulfokora sp.]|nr:MAG: 30S ribosomal protein S13 [Candidatus Korarchaeota archaeon]
MASEFRKMIRILNTTVDGDRTIYAALASVKGIGFSLANAVLKKAGIDRYKRAGELTDEEISRIEEAVRSPSLPSWLFNRQRDPVDGKDYILVGDEVTLAERRDISVMKKIKSWKGIRHSLGLKVRGQRTRTTGRSGRTVGYSKREKG